MKYTISGYSTALFSTWINVEELNLLIDAGDGVSAGLLHKSGKIKHVFITHPDRDHLTGLAQFVQLNAREGFPKIHYPKDAGSFPAMRDFLTKFDPHVAASEWIGIENKSTIEIKKNTFVQAIRNEHIVTPVGVNKSLSYKVIEVKHKLKPEHRSKTEREIQELIRTNGKDSISDQHSSTLISFSGDTPVDDYSKWDGSEILIHESTFLETETDANFAFKANKHSSIQDVLKMVSEIKVNHLILNHFSSRYSKEQIDLTVRKLIKEYNLQIPVYLMYPGELKRDILNTSAVNE